MGTTPYLKFYDFLSKMIIITRDAMRKRGLCSRPVSVRLSVRYVRVLYPDVLKISSNFFLSLVAPSF